MFDINNAKEAINQFKRWEKSGWSKSEVPNTYMLILAIEALEEKIQANTPPDFESERTMSLEGGISGLYGKYRICTPPKGRKVRYLDRNGYGCDRENARKYFKKGSILTVHEIYIGDWKSSVEFEEFPGEIFNTVMFEDAED